MLVDRLSPCQSYWLKPTGVDCAALVRTSPQKVAAFEADPSELVISVSTSGDSNIVLSWRNSGQNFLEQVESLQVTVTSECPTGKVSALTQVFTMTPDEGNSLTIMGLGMHRLL